MKLIVRARFLIVAMNLQISNGVARMIHVVTDSIGDIIQSSYLANIANAHMVTYRNSIPEIYVYANTNRYISSYCHPK